MIVKPTSIWSEFTTIPPAPPPGWAIAQANAIANPTIIADYTGVGAALHCTPTDANGRTYYITSTYDDKSTRMGNWIMPALIPRTDAGWEGEPSFGYMPVVYNGDPDSGGTPIALTAEQVGATVGWWMNFGAGAISFASSFAGIVDITDVWFKGFQYIGATGGTGGAAGAGLTIFSYPFTAQTAITVPHNLSTRNLLLKIVDDGTNDYDITQLAYSIEYTDVDNVDITFAAPTSGVVVIGKFQGETFYGDYTSELVNEHRHYFNQNHTYTTYDPASYADLRYAMSSYLFQGAWYDNSAWIAARDAEFFLTAGASRRYMQRFTTTSTMVANHELDTKDTFIQIQDDLGYDITSLAQSIQYNQNNVTVTWAAPQQARLIVMG